MATRQLFTARQIHTRPIVSYRIVTAHPSTASVQITVLVYNSSLLCSLNVSIKGLKSSTGTKLNYLLNERREDVSGDGKRVEKQETRHRFEIFR